MSNTGLKKGRRVGLGAWWALVGKGGTSDDDSPVGFDEVLTLMKNSRSTGGERWDDVHVICLPGQVDPKSGPDGFRRIAEQVAAADLKIATVVAPVWPGAGGDVAFGDANQRAGFLAGVRTGCEIAKTFTDLGIRTGNTVRVDSAGGVPQFLQDRSGNRKRLIEAFREATRIAKGFGQQLSAEPEICWGGLHTVADVIAVCESVFERGAFGLQIDMSHAATLMFSKNDPDFTLPGLGEGFDWSEDQSEFRESWKWTAQRLRPYMNDFHVAASDGTIRAGSGGHDATGKHCLPWELNVFNIVQLAGDYLGEAGRLDGETEFPIAWDSCMAPTGVLKSQETWDRVLDKVCQVRKAHAWKAAA